MKPSGIFYNEIDPYAARWLENLAQADEISNGVVCRDDIRKITPESLAAFQQCHFFAGIGVWSYALRLAGWPDDNAVWTGSCPCQPFSGAGKRAGFADDRHLWPVWFDLIRQRCPGVILGEQVASPDGYAWFDHVQADMESLGYACGAVVAPAAGYGAPEERHRIYWMAYADGLRFKGVGWCGATKAGGRVTKCGETSGLADSRSARWRAGCWSNQAGEDRRSAGGTIDTMCGFGGLGNAEGIDRRLPEGCTRPSLSKPSGASETGQLGNSARVGHGADDLESLSGWRERPTRPSGGAYASGEPATGPTNSFWRDADWLFCRDGKWRPVEPGTFPLADGVANRVAQLRAYGNALIAPQAVEFVRAVMDVIKSDTRIEVGS